MEEFSRQASWLAYVELGGALQLEGFKISRGCTRVLIPPDFIDFGCAGWLEHKCDLFGVEFEGENSFGKEFKVVEFLWKSIQSGGIPLELNLMWWNSFGNEFKALEFLWR